MHSLARPTVRRAQLLVLRPSLLNEDIILMNTWDSKLAAKCFVWLNRWAYQRSIMEPILIEILLAKVYGLIYRPTVGAVLFFVSKPSELGPLLIRPNGQITDARGNVAVLVNLSSVVTAKQVGEAAWDTLTWARESLAQGCDLEVSVIVNPMLGIAGEMELVSDSGGVTEIVDRHNRLVQVSEEKIVTARPGRDCAKHAGVRVLTRSDCPQVCMGKFIKVIGRERFAAVRSRIAHVGGGEDSLHVYGAGERVTGRPVDDRADGCCPYGDCRDPLTVGGIRRRMVMDVLIEGGEMSR